MKLFKAFLDWLIGDDYAYESNEDYKEPIVLEIVLCLAGSAISIYSIITFIQQL